MNKKQSPKQPFKQRNEFSYHAISWHRHVNTGECGGVAPSNLRSSQKSEGSRKIYAFHEKLFHSLII